jgi:N-acetylglutamate synthase-like GNAT family acetyltransferase
MLAEGLLWVAEDQGRLLGFAACQMFLDALHLWELAVRREDQGRGVGKALVEAVVAEARAQDMPQVTLTTFREIPWNGPFYATLGFQEIAPPEMNGRLTAILMREKRLGLDAAARCAMRLRV